MIDYIIVGSGLAGISFAETALQQGMKVLVFDNDSQTSTRIAGGIYNPVILKRFSGLAQAQDQIALLNAFYARLEEKLGLKLDYKMPVLRKFASIEEQNNWFVAADKITLAPFLSTKFVTSKYHGIDSPYDYGQVLQTGYVDTAVLLEGYQGYLEKQGWLVRDTFDYSSIELTDEGVTYKDIKARKIVFAEGFGLHGNPFFKDLPLDGTKGELLIIKAPELKLDAIVNASIFILPLGNDHYKVGATYEWYDKTNAITEKGKAELLEKIKETLTCDFEIIAHLAGIRPTVKDRKAMLGTHPDYSNLHILNGLGTRGVMLGPYMARILWEHIEKGVPLEREIDIRRYYK